jgi:hypothetical protein
MPHIATTGHLPEIEDCSGEWASEINCWVIRMRRARHASASGQSRGQIVDAVSIRERPAEVEDRAVPGHWEGDLLAGAKNTYMATRVERHSRFAMRIKVPSKNTEVVVAAWSQHVRKLPATLKRSLTWDRGLAMAKHKDFTVATDVQVYFCDPQSPWQRGTNENTNLLLRQYFPFAAADAFHLERLGRMFKTVLDCGLFHTFNGDERPGYVASLASVTEHDGTLYVLCFSNDGPDTGPHPISQQELRAAFSPSNGWNVAAIEPDRIQTRYHDHGAPAWFATIKRI